MPVKNIILRNAGKIDKDRIESYIACDGLNALKKAYEMGPDKVIQEVKDSSLRGRGGAGFPCGLKWELARKSPGSEKYVICNIDEGEVGTFKDRAILETDPFSLIEGAAIAAYAVGAKTVYFYLRREYRRLKKPLEKAIHQVKEQGFLQPVDLLVYEGAGAYVCGEESALMNSIEGKRGEARFRPPFPPEAGLWNKPTVINNVETLMNIPPIILNGASWYKEIGTEKSKGTKVFCVSGDVPRPGVYELEMGSPLRELVETLAGATDVKAVIIGGSTGKIVPFDQIDARLAFENVLGTGSVIVLKNGRNIAHATYEMLKFLSEESCGKCSPGREGVNALYQIHKKFIENRGTENDLARIKSIASMLGQCALCGLCQASPNILLEGLKHYRNEYLREGSGKTEDQARC